MSENRIFRAICSRPRALVVLLFGILAVAQLESTLAATACISTGIAECEAEFGFTESGSTAELEAEENDPDTLAHRRDAGPWIEPACQTRRRTNPLIIDLADDDPEPD